MCPLLAQLIIGFFSVFLPFTVLMKKTHAVKQSIFLDVYGLGTIKVFTIVITTVELLVTSTQQ